MRLVGPSVGVNERPRPNPTLRKGAVNVYSGQLTFLLQACDSNFPNGAFSHSFGLETLIVDGMVKDVETFQIMLEEWFYLQVVPFDGLASHLAWECAIRGDLSGICDIANTMSVSILPEETRSGVLGIGKRSLQELSRMVPGGMAERYWEAVCAGIAASTHSVALAVAAADLGIGQTDTVTAVLYNNVCCIVSAAVRAVPLGQTAGQRVLAHCRKWMEKIPSYSGRTVDELSSTSVVWEIAQMNHKQLSGRLFMS
jgi:urease accessory protein